jgi:hypothetical protein
MKHLPFFLLLGLIALSSFTHPNPKVKTYELQKAIDEGLVELLSIEHLGKKQLKIRIKNLNKRKDFKVHFKTGLQFASQDTSLQDQIIVQGRSVLVRAAKSVSPTFTSYCTQASNISPGSGSVFSLKKEADGKLMELASFLSKKRDMDYMIQQAVWVVSDEHDLRGLHHEDSREALEIQEFVSKLTGKPLPEYTIRYKEALEGQQAFTREAVMVVGLHRYQLAEDGYFSCRIYNEAGELVQEVFENMLQKKGNVRFNFKLKAWNLPKGKYVSRVFKDGELFEEKWVSTV